MSRRNSTSGASFSAGIVTGGNVEAARFLATANNTAAAPSFLVEPAGNSGLYWDATKGVVASVDAVDRIMARVNGTTEVSSGQVGTVSIFRMTNASLSVDVYAASGLATPEAVITAAVGALCISTNASASKLWQKRTGTGNTGWVQIDRCESGTYTPTATALTNLDSVSVQGTFRYTRVGDVVYAEGTVSADPTASGAYTFALTLPVASNFTTAYQGSGRTVSSAPFSGRGFADTTNDRIEFNVGNNTATVASDVFVAFSYVVL